MILGESYDSLAPVVLILHVKDQWRISEDGGWKDGGTLDYFFLSSEVLTLT